MRTSYSNALPPKAMLTRTCLPLSRCCGETQSRPARALLYPALKIMRRRHAGSSLSQLRLGNFMKSYLLSLLLIASCTFSVAQAPSRPAYLEPSKPIEQRVADLIGRLTLEEKAAQLNHLNTGVPRLNIPMRGGWNQTLHGVWSKEPTTLFPAPIAM